MSKVWSWRLETSSCLHGSIPLVSNRQEWQLSHHSQFVQFGLLPLTRKPLTSPLLFCRQSWTHWWMRMHWWRVQWTRKRLKTREQHRAHMRVLTWCTKCWSDKLLMGYSQEHLWRERQVLSASWPPPFYRRHSMVKTVIGIRCHPKGKVALVL